MNAYDCISVYACLICPSVSVEYIDIEGHCDSKLENAMELFTSFSQQPVSNGLKRLQKEAFKSKEEKIASSKP
jgi:hypothetical protein